MDRGTRAQRLHLSPGRAGAHEDRQQGLWALRRFCAAYSELGVAPSWQHVERDESGTAAAP